MHSFQPYTYLIGRSKYNLFYYGVRYATHRGSKGGIANPSTLWKTYFTSSKSVAVCRTIYGEPDIIQIRKTFTTVEAAIAWEAKVLSKLDAANDPRFLNATNGDRKFINRAQTLSDEQKSLLSLRRKEWWNRNPDYKVVMSKRHKGKKLTQAQIDNLRNIHRKWYLLTDAKGVEHVTDNLLAFCQLHGLNQGNMSSVIKGRLTHHKGWRTQIISKPLQSPSLQRSGTEESHHYL